MKQIAKLIIGLVLLISLDVAAQDGSSIKELKTDKSNWSIQYDKSAGKADLFYKNRLLVKEMFSVAYTEGRLTSDKYESHTISQENIFDERGSGVCFSVLSASENKPDMIQRFYIYDNLDYFLVQLELHSEDRISSNYLAPIATRIVTSIFAEGDNRVLTIPFDNDKWIRYKSSAFNGGINSYEVTAFYNSQNRDGMVVGSIDHDTWKSGIRVEGLNLTDLKRLECYSGTAGELTRDVLPHGKVSGTSVKSSRFMVGFFDDWRSGLEEFAKVCTSIAPSRKWDSGTPFGWNSWGRMQFNMTFEKVLEVSDFVAETIQKEGFSNNGVTYIGMDAGWNGMSDEQLAEIVTHCKANGQKAGIYFTPFTDWGKNPEKDVDGTSGYKFKDVYLYANGKPQELDGAWAIDPTHPAVKERIAFYADKFKKAGFEYLKIDFLTHGAMESDYHYDRNVTTGIQAYNQGMAHLAEQMKGMYITMAISPLFPSQYAHSRRIACDAFANMNDAEYTLNALSYGWWLGDVYCYNDPDHIVLEGAREGENRARITSGVITGIYMSGDDFSEEGTKFAKQKAYNFLTNKDINDLARIEKAFMPVNGSDENSDCMFMLQSGKYTYLAVFNYTAYEVTYNIPLSKLDLKGQNYEVKELWSSEELTVKNNLKVQLPPKDVKVYRVEL